MSSAGTKDSFSKSKNKDPISKPRLYELKLTVKFVEIKSNCSKNTQKQKCNEIDCYVSTNKERFNK